MMVSMMANTGAGPALVHGTGIVVTAGGDIEDCLEVSAFFLWEVLKSLSALGIGHCDLGCMVIYGSVIIDISDNIS